MLYKFPEEFGLPTSNATVVDPANISESDPNLAELSNVPSFAPTNGVFSYEPSDVPSEVSDVPSDVPSEIPSDEPFQVPTTGEDTELPTTDVLGEVTLAPNPANSTGPTPTPNGDCETVGMLKFLP
jgi:hypothetical protein